MKNLNHWREVAIPEVLFYQEGPGVRNTQFRDHGVKLLNVGNINNGTINLSSTKTHLAEDEANGKYAHFLINEGDLLIACSGIVVDNFHNKIAFASKEHLPLCLNTSTMRFKSLNPDVLEILFFKYFLQSQLFKNQISRLITGSAQLNFGPSHIKKIKIPLPPLEQQKKIAAILDAADAYRQLTKALIAKYDELTQSLFLDMFGDPVKNEKGWEKLKGEELCEKISVGVVIKPASYYSEKGVLALRSLNIKPFRIDLNDVVYFSEVAHQNELKKSTLKHGDVVVVRTGNTGTAAVIPVELDGINCIDLIIIRVNLLKLNAVYLCHFLNSERGKEIIAGKSVGGIHKHFNVGAMKGTYVPIPPLPLQNQFAERGQAIEQQKAQAQASLEKAEELFNSLLQRAFKGELV